MKMNSEDYTQWNLPQGAKARHVTGAINDIQFSPDGTQLAVASSIGIWIYDVHTGEKLNLLLGHKGPVSSIAYLQNEHILASGAGDGTVRLWDVERGMTIKLYRLGSLIYKAFTALYSKVMDAFLLVDVAGVCSLCLVAVTTITTTTQVYG